MEQSLAKFCSTEVGWYRFGFRVLLYWFTWYHIVELSQVLGYAFRQGLDFTNIFIFFGNNLETGKS